MNILFDQGTPVPLGHALRPHRVDTAAERGWCTLENGRLIQEAEREGYDAMITTDQNIKYQQDLSGRKIRLLVLKTTSWPRIQRKAQQVKNTLEQMADGAYGELDF